MKCHFIAVSEAVYEYLKELGTETRRISLIHNAIHLMEQNQKTIHPSFRESIGWEKNHYVVIVVGRLEPVKGHKFLIDAIRQVAPERPRLRCLVVGEGRERERLEAQVKRFHLEGIVHFTGFRDDIETLLNASDAFCMPSLSEALPYALLEACSCRLPLLVTEVGGMAKLLTHGKNAIFIKPVSSDALVKGLFRLIDNPEENVILGSAAFELVQKHFSVEQMVAETMKRYGVQETVR
jgi:glycosyltransferase involved in cell wall biosynthesis